MKTETEENFSSITPKELEKRREAVDVAISTHTLEGIKLHPKTLEF
ncbi:hypothetical protein [Bartonella quintana]